MSDMLKLVVVVGIPGVGKSTVLSIAKNKLVEKGYNVKLVNFGDYMFNYLKETGMVRTRDEIRRLPLTIQLKTQGMVAKKIREELESEKRERVIGIVDTHAVIKTTVGFWPGLPMNVVLELKPSLIAVIEAKAEEIVARQQRDTSRYRADLSNIELVKELLQINRYFSIASSVISGAAVVFISNHEGLSEKAAEELVAAIEAS